MHSQAGYYRSSKVCSRKGGGLVGLQRKKNKFNGGLFLTRRDFEHDTDTMKGRTATLGMVSCRYLEQKSYDKKGKMKEATDANSHD